MHQAHGAALLAYVEFVVGRARDQGNVFRVVIRVFVVHIIGNDAARKAGRKFAEVFDGVVDDHGAFGRNIFHVFAEGVTDVVHILKEVHVLRLDVENDLIQRVQVVETVGVLAGLRQEDGALAAANGAADLRELAAHGDGRIQSGCQQDVGHDRGGRGLSVRSGHTDRDRIFAHDLP